MASVRASCRLASTKQRSAKEEKEAAQHISASSSSEPPGVSSGARWKWEHRYPIKKDPVQHKLYREKENVRLQATRANRMPDQKAEAKIKTEMSPGMAATTENATESGKETGKPPNKSANQGEEGKRQTAPAEIQSKSA